MAQLAWSAVYAAKFIALHKMPVQTPFPVRTPRMLGASLPHEKEAEDAPPTQTQSNRGMLYINAGTRPPPYNGARAEEACSDY